MMAKTHLESSQKKMKRLYDRRVERREFSPGDQVMALIPLAGSPFQAKFSGPYMVVRKVSELNYLIETPDRRKSVQLHHLNLLKPYFARKTVADSTVSPVAAVIPIRDTNSPNCEEAEVCTHGDGILQGRLKNFGLCLSACPGLI